MNKSMNKSMARQNRETTAPGGKGGKKRKLPAFVVILLIIAAFALLFAYLNMNLKTIDYGYEMQDLLNEKLVLLEEIDKLKSDRARLLNLERVEKTVIEKLGYQYPEADQFIKVFETGAESYTGPNHMKKIEQGAQ